MLKRSHNAELAATGAAVFLIAVLAVAFKPSEQASVHPVQSTAVTTSSARVSWPPAMGGPDIVKERQRMPTDVKREIVDSDEWLSLIARIDAASPTETKLGAWSILVACTHAPREPRPFQSDAERSAIQALAARCEPINAALPNAMVRAAEVRRMAEADATPLGQLISLSKRSLQGSGWEPYDAALVDAALRSGDSVLLVEANAALYAKLNDGSPDAALRAGAAQYALDSHIGAHERPQFDRLAECAVASRCADRGPLDPIKRYRGVREQTEIARLIEQYQLALRRNASLADMLAIR